MSHGPGTCITGAAFDKIRQHPEWAPKLKYLGLQDVGCSAGKREKTFKKSMRDLTRERNGLTVELITRDESKRWGDWELEVSREKYRKGRSMGYGR